MDLSLRKPTRHESRILLVSLLLLTAFLLVASLKAELTPIDTAVNSWSASIHTISITSIAIAVSDLFDTTVLLPIALLISIILYLRHYRNYATLLAAAMVGIALLVEVLKDIIRSPRPTVIESGFSFPSGHVTNTMVFFGLLTYFAWQHWKNSVTKTLVAILYIAIEALVGFCRVYLNVHWLSDILGGYLLGAFWVTLMIFILLYSEKQDRSQPI